MKFVLFVEGRTEKALPGFLKRWLDARLTVPVGIRVVRLNGWSDYVAEIGDKVALNLSGGAGADVIAAIGLIDLYGPTYPNGVAGVDARYAWAKSTIESRVRHSLFRQHLAVHESEAWLLSDPGILPRPVRESLPARCERPETVDFDDPPSALLSRLYDTRLSRSYKKVTDGLSLFQALSPEKARERCPYFARLLDDMLSLARAAMRERRA